MNSMIGVENECARGKRWASQAQHQPTICPTYRAKTTFCFAAGTLVHTKDGLKPIQDIKVGDLVWSRPESGDGEAAYKPVLRTIRSEQQEVFFISYRAKEYDDEYDRTGKIIPPEALACLVVTGNHPFWFKGSVYDGRWGKETRTTGWLRADLLESGDILELSDGRSVVTSGVQKIYTSKTADIGWIPSTAWIPWEEDPELDTGTYIDLSNNQYHYDFTRSGESVSDDAEDIEPLRCTVYNFEVADYHTYFVGERAVWVHNTNCGEIDLTQALRDYQWKRPEQDFEIALPGAPKATIDALIENMKAIEANINKADLLKP